MGEGTVRRNGHQTADCPEGWRCGGWRLCEAGSEPSPSEREICRSQQQMWDALPIDGWHKHMALSATGPAPASAEG